MIYRHPGIWMAQRAVIDGIEPGAAGPADDRAALDRAAAGRFCLGFVIAMPAF